MEGGYVVFSWWGLKSEPWGRAGLNWLGDWNWDIVCFCLNG